MTDAVVLRHRVTPGASDAVRELVAEQVAGGDAGPDALVGVPGVQTASLFLDQSRVGTPDLVWYLEVDDAERDQWADPASALRRHSPLFAAGLGEHLDAPDATRVLSDAAPGGAELVHATLPGRPTTVGTDAVPSSDDSTGPAPDVVLLRLAIRPGVGEYFVRALAGLTARLDDEGRVERTFDEWTQPVLEAESMWTESIFLERTGGDYALLWYMEAADMAQVGEAYYATSNPVARISEVVLGRLLTDPERALSNPAASSDHELLAHAVSPERA